MESDDTNLVVPPDHDNADMAEDMRLFMRTVAAFRQYEVQARTALIVRQQNFAMLPDHHKALLARAGLSLDQMFVQYHDGITANQQFLNAICDASTELFESYWPTSDPSSIPMDEPTAMDYDKVFSTLRQFVRDWSEEGALERQQAYGPIVGTLASLFPNRATRHRVRILVPGAGLCRLSVELALQGFACQANEFSYHMLIAGHYAQNHIECRHQHRVLPHVDNTCNLVDRGDQFAPCLIPDVCVMDTVHVLAEQGLSFGELSMVAGDFTEVYRKPCHQGKWEVVASCFFLDTAHNIVDYLEIIFSALVPGGVLVNLGPLLYHFADAASCGGGGAAATSSPHGVNSVELSLREVMDVAQAIGFVVHTPPQLLDTTYTGNVRSMKQLVYRAAFFVLRKPPLAPQSQGSGRGEAAANASTTRE